ncbi:MAG: D-alanyl-D-alanine carboxypeptidase [Eubacteriales bacterium]|nr:D-alanyl-D-alanine carboxypeptidase [Eubacteriales bacterium]
MFSISKKKFYISIFIFFLVFSLTSSFTVKAASGTLSEGKLYSRYCALIDGDSGRLLYGKNPDAQAPMASTTKIMTCYLALKCIPDNYTATTSAYAASMPDVQLNAVKGQQFRLSDLLYSLMLKSHNDTAVIIAENYAFHYLCTNPAMISNDTFKDINLSFLTSEMLASDDSSVLSGLKAEESKALVQVFACFMNQQAESWGCTHTYYITPNGLDAADETGEHCTTAYELAIVMSKCIDVPEFNAICQTKSYSFSDLSNKSTYTVTNANAFLNMYENIIAGKTGFTGNAGYCYVCAYKADGRTFIVALLACGWPPDKTRKWKDARLLLNYAREHYYKKEILGCEILTTPVKVYKGDSDYAYVQNQYPYDTLLSDFDSVNILYDIPSAVNAPVYSGTYAGNAHIYINDTHVLDIPLTYCSSISKVSFISAFITLLDNYLL